MRMEFFFFVSEKGGLPMISFAVLNFNVLLYVCILCCDEVYS